MVEKLKFIHTSDWHLGRILHGKHLTEDQFYILQQFIYIIKNENQCRNQCQG